MPSIPAADTAPRGLRALSHPTLRALLAIVLFTYTAQNMLNASIAPLSRALGIPGWVVGAAVSLAAVAVTALSQFWGRRSIAWGRRRVLLTALVLALIAALLFSGAVALRSAGMIAPLVAGAAIMVARGPFFGAAVAAIPPTGQALIALTIPEESRRVGAMSAFSGSIQLSIMIGSLISSALGAWWILAPVHATPLFVAIALVIGVLLIPRDRPDEGGAADSSSAPMGGPRGGGASPLPPRVAWTDPRVLPWILGVFGMFFTTGVVQITVGFLVQDRLGLAPEEAVTATALMLLANAAGAMLVQLVLVPRSSWAPLRLLRTGMTIGLAALGVLAFSDSWQLLAASTFVLGAANGLAAPGFTAGASLAVGEEEQGGVAGVINATGSLTWIFAPVSATALYGWRTLSPFLLALGLVGVSTAFAWLHPGLHSWRPARLRPADSPERV